jgi:AraC-like DNA-binding protein
MSYQPKSATVLEGRFTWAQYAPHASLTAWISSYWTMHAEGRHVVRTFPDACIDITLQLAPERRAFVDAPQTRAQTWPTEHAVHLVGARLLPGAAGLLGIAVDALAEGWTPLEAVLPAKVVAQWLRRVSSAKDALAQTAALDAFFAERLLNRALDPRLGKAFREVFARRGDVTVTELARLAGAHPRTLSRLFEQSVGLTPKRFARIVRLQSALRALPDGASWTSVALDLGYCDQAHFIREVKELFGSTPREVMRMASPTA